MKKMILAIIILLVIIFAGCFFIFYKKTTQICSGNNCFKIQVADNFASREVGLMFRKNLEQNEGMLFVFPKEDIYPFWMKYTFIPLDIIWINESKEVVFVSQNTQPCKKGPCPQIDPQAKAKYVLELNAGAAQKADIIVGSTLNFTLTK